MVMWETVFSMQCPIVHGLSDSDMQPHLRKQGWGQTFVLRSNANDRITVIRKLHVATCICFTFPHSEVLCCCPLTSSPYGTKDNQESKRIRHCAATEWHMMTLILQWCQCCGELKPSCQLSRPLGDWHPWVTGLINYGVFLPPSQWSFVVWLYSCIMSMSPPYV